MRVGCITDLVDALHDGIKSRIVSDCGICSVKVIVDGTRQAYARDVILLRNHLSSSERAVSADDNKRIDSVRLYIFIRLRASLLIHEALASRCPEDGAAAVDRAADALRGKLLYLIVDQAFPASVYTFDLPAVVDCSPCHRPDGGIHTGSISSRSKYTYSSYFCHIVQLIMSKHANLQNSMQHHKISESVSYFCRLKEES